MAWLVDAAAMGVPAHFNRYSTAWAAADNVAGATALALWGWCVVASGTRQPMRAVHLGAAGMLGWTAFTFVQALLGQPLIG